MSGSGVLTRREVRSDTAALRDRRAHQARSTFTSEREVLDAEDQEEVERRRANRFSIKGRLVIGEGRRGLSARVVWDVYALDGFDVPHYCAGGFTFPEEAVLYARDQLLGRVSIAVSQRGASSAPAVRGMFRAQRGGLLVPTQHVDTPGATPGVVVVGDNARGFLVTEAPAARGQ